MKNKLLILLFGISIYTQIIVAQVPSYVPANGLVGYWPFNGNAINQTGAGFNGIVNGATLTTDRFGNTNSAYLFNGINNYIDLGNITVISQTSGISMSAWILWDGSNAIRSEQYIFQLAQKPNGQISISDNGNLVINVLNCNCVNDIGINTLITQNTWYHVVLTYDLSSGTMKMYLNGNLINTIQENMFTYYTVNNTPSRFGNYYFNSLYFKGKIDEGILYNRALTQLEINSLYTNLNVEQFTDKFQFSLYPNPAKDQITIDIGPLNNVSGWKLKIINSVGQVVLSNVINSNQHLIPIDDSIAKGIYFVKIYDNFNNLLKTKKLILQ